MVRIHFLQLWNIYSDPAVEVTLHYIAVYRWLAGLDSGVFRPPDESTLSRFRHFLEKFCLSQTKLTKVDASP